MIKVFKKNQIVIFALALVMITVGYLNYSVDKVEIGKTSGIIDEDKVATIGDAVLVSSENVDTLESKSTNDKNESNNENEEKNVNVVSNGYINLSNNSENINLVKDNENLVKNNENSIKSNENLAKGSENTNLEKSNENISTVNSKIKSTDSNKYFKESRLERENMYSEMLESHQMILSNPNISADQKMLSQNEISKISSQKNAIMIAENLIKNKGFEEIVIFVNNESVSVVIGAEKLSEAEIAQVQNIIERELKVNVSNIHISTK